MAGTTHSLEQRDREHFDRNSSKYVAKDLFAASRRARQLRLWQTLDSVDLNADAQILEVGCGAGFAASYLEGRYSRFIGIDYSEKLIKYANFYNARPGASFECANATTYYSDIRFDVIFMIGVLHHLEDASDTLRNIIRLLKSGGWLVANEPQPNNTVISTLRGIRKKLDRSYSDEQKELSGKEIAKLFESQGLRGIKARGQGLFSTPFAEVRLKPGLIARRLSEVSCIVDRAIEKVLGQVLSNSTWNVIVAGQKVEDEVVQ